MSNVIGYQQFIVILSLLFCAIGHVFAGEPSQSLEDSQQSPPIKAEIKATDNQVNAKAPQKIQQTVLGMNVTGNKESPNVLYIVPWKSNPVSQQPAKPSRLVEEIYAPVDPESFARQVEFYDQITHRGNAVEAND